MVGLRLLNDTVICSVGPEIEPDYEGPIFSGFHGCIYHGLGYDGFQSPHCSIQAA